MKFNSVLLAFVVLLFVVSACDSSTSTSRSNTKSVKPEKKIGSLIAPSADSVYKMNQEISLQFSFRDTFLIDSVQVFFDGERIGSFDGHEAYFLNTGGTGVGKKSVRAKVYFNNGKTETHSRQLELLSDVVPKQYSFRIKKQYTHDVGAYTQGLVYYDGWLYEGTGNYNQSTLRKVRVSNGEVVQIRNNAADIFGEGICIFEGKIYQLSYKSQVCFVYDLNTFEEKNKLYFQNKEGWGLCTMGDELVMSDGTNVLYFIDPDMFTIKRQVEVYDNRGPVDALNELELIGGKIYANRYYTDEIVIIDPTIGRVEGRINLKGILPVKERKPSTNVLNGIAWDEKGGRLFVTGKYWPKLYEIELIKIGE